MVDEETGQEYHGHRICISGNQLSDLAEHICMDYKKCDTPSPNKDSDCWGIQYVTQRVATKTSYGFTLEGGKQQVLLGDFTVMQVA